MESFRVSVYLSVFGIILCTCCSFFCKSVTLWTALQIPLWSKTHLVFRHKVYEIALSEVLATQMGVTEAQHKSQLVWIVQIWPILASQRVDIAGTRALLCFGLLVSCYSLMQYNRPAWLSFLLTTRIHIQWLQSKKATALTPRLTSLPKSHVTDEESETAVSASLQKIKSIHKLFFSD